MASDEMVQTIGRLIDDLYEGCEELARDEIYRRVEAAHVTPEVSAYFSHLPEGDYTLDELVDEIGVEADETGDTGGLGLLD